MRQTRLITLVRGAAFLVLATVAAGSECFAEEIFDLNPAREVDLPLNTPSPKPVPDYSERAQIQDRFGEPTRTFSLFRSPTSYGASCKERCTPELFSPRGIGFARRTGCDRMDYSPYVAEFAESSHGPSYYKRYHLYPCFQQHHFEKHGTKIGWQYYY